MMVNKFKVVSKLDTGYLINKGDVVDCEIMEYWSDGKSFIISKDSIFHHICYGIKHFKKEFISLQEYRNQKINRIFK